MPRGNPGNWVKSGDYPIEALRAGVQGVVAFSIAFDTEGRPTQCTITATSGSSVLDRKTCEVLMLRAEFIPGRDAKGAPTGGRYLSRMRWIVPQSGTIPMPAPLPTRAIVTYRIDADGKPSQCKIERTGNKETSLNLFNPCNYPVSYPPYRDEKGKPVDRVVTMTVDVTVTDP